MTSRPSATDVKEAIASAPLTKLGGSNSESDECCCATAELLKGVRGHSICIRRSLPCVSECGNFRAQQLHRASGFFQPSGSDEALLPSSSGNDEADRGGGPSRLLADALSRLMLVMCTEEELLRVAAGGRPVDELGAVETAAAAAINRVLDGRTSGKIASEPFGGERRASFKGPTNMCGGLGTSAAALGALEAEGAFTAAAEPLSEYSFKDIVLQRPPAIRAAAMPSAAVADVCCSVCSPGLLFPLLAGSIV